MYLFIYLFINLFIYSSILLHSIITRLKTYPCRKIRFRWIQSYRCSCSYQGDSCTLRIHGTHRCSEHIRLCL